jgi:hypothetical protein
VYFEYVSCSRTVMVLKSRALPFISSSI